MSRRRFKINKECAKCAKPFVTSISWQKFCKPRCAQAASRARHFTPPSTLVLKIPTATVGAMHELVASVHLMRCGLHVFRALSPACRCDLIVLMDDEPIRVEVRSGTRSINTGSVFYVHGDAERADIVAVIVSGETTPAYVPLTSSGQRLKEFIDEQFARSLSV